MEKNFFKIGKFSGKGATAVICFCLAAVAALGIYSYSKSADELTKELSGEQGAVSETEAVTEADAAADNVPFTDVYESKEDIELAQDAFGDSDPSAEPAEADAENTENAVLTGAVVRPLNGEIINAFSDGELVKSKTLGVWKTHDGIDISGSLGESVKSMAEGTVTSVENDPMLGVTVVIDHGSGITGYYSNLAAEVSVSEGDTVSAGTVIGSVGQTAEGEICEEPHIHFAVKKNGSWVDPAAILSGEGS